VVRFNMPTAKKAMLLDEQNWQRYQRGLPFGVHAGGFTAAMVTHLKPRCEADWHLVVDGRDDLAATFEIRRH